jgi:VanZ family protein
MAFCQRPRNVANLLLTAALVAVLGCDQRPASQPRFVRQIEWAEQGSWLKADTHIHTTFSDGAHSVAEVAAKAIEHGCDCIAITDHADSNLDAATREYHEEIQAARRRHPELIVLAGLEWNVPGWAGDQQATILMPPGPDEGLRLADFKASFGDLPRDQDEPGLADPGLRWLGRVLVDDLSPIVICEHPSRQRQTSDEVLGDLRRWRAVNDLVVGFSGAPGHQGMQPVGAYKSALSTIDRWDPAAAEVGGAWDTLLGQGVDFWGAHATSDFHDAKGLGDYWPGEFSETWLYVPERSARGALRALKAGSFFAVHGQIARQVELRVDAQGLPRSAYAGEMIELERGAIVTPQLRFETPQLDWSGEPNRIDAVELIAVTAAGARVVATREPDVSHPAISIDLEVPEEGLVLRGRGRRIVEDGPDLMFYTNPVRVLSTANVAPPAGFAPGKWLETIRARGLGVSGWLALAGGLLALFIVGRWLRRGTSSRVRATASDASPSPPRASHFFLLALGFAAFAIYGSLIPMNYRPLSWAETLDRFRAVPFYDLDVEYRADWLSNMVLFVPIGFFGTAALTVDRRSRFWQATSALLVALACAVFSIALELSQFWFPPRTVSQNDIVAEIIGAVVGSGIWFMIGSYATAWVRSVFDSREPAARLDWLLQAYTVFLFLYCVVPLDVTIHPNELWQKISKGKIQIAPIEGRFAWQGSAYDVLANALVFSPLGVLAARTRARSRRGDLCLAESVLIGLAITTGVEICQVFVYTRVASTLDVITGTGGIVVGFWATRRWLSRSPQNSLAESRPVVWWRLPALILTYCAVLIASYWAPYELIEDPGEIPKRWVGFLNVPFTNLYYGEMLDWATQISRKGLSFAVLGAMLARWVSAWHAPAPLRRFLLLVLLCAASGFGFLIEVGQLWLVASTPDCTDVILYTMGAATGMIAACFVLGGQKSAGYNAGFELPDHCRQPAARKYKRVSGWRGWPVSSLLAAGTAAACVSLWYYWSPSAFQEAAAVARVVDGPSESALGVKAPANPLAAPELKRVPVPDFSGGYASWGAAGDDSHGHIWFAVSASNVPEPSAHLFEYDPVSAAVFDRGDVVGELKRLSLHRTGARQMTIPSRIVEADDGHLYFASVARQSEKAAGAHSLGLGSHLWRLQLPSAQWQHLLSVQEDLVAVAAGGAHVYCLGDLDHMLYQYHRRDGKLRSVSVGSVAGHVSRNILCDARGHVFVPRLRPAKHAGQPADVTLVEFNPTLQEVAETSLAHYLTGNDVSSHGIVAFQPLSDGSIAFVTHVGYLYRLAPHPARPAEVQPLGWFHPRGEAYITSLFTYESRYLVGASLGATAEWVTFDLEKRQATSVPLDQLRSSDVVYGSATKDKLGNFYLAGTRRGQREHPVPLVFQVQPPL